jgi:hypothetical protein
MLARQPGLSSLPLNKVIREKRKAGKTPAFLIQFSLVRFRSDAMTIIETL